jgi:hypothetical protein
MKSLLFILLFVATFAWAQDKAPDNSRHDHDKDAITVQGCLSRSSGDYVLIKQHPAMTYELQATGKIHLRDYLGQRVEVTGEQGPTMSSSSDAMNKTGSASSVAISVSSIKTIDRQCQER